MKKFVALARVSCQNFCCLCGDADLSRSCRRIEMFFRVRHGHYALLDFSKLPFNQRVNKELFALWRDFKREAF